MRAATFREDLLGNVVFIPPNRRRRGTGTRPSQRFAAEKVPMSSTENGPS